MQAWCLIVFYTFRRGGRPPWSHLVLGRMWRSSNFWEATRKFLGVRSCGLAPAIGVCKSLGITPIFLPHTPQFLGRLGCCLVSFQSRRRGINIDDLGRWFYCGYFVSIDTLLYEGGKIHDFAAKQALYGSYWHTSKNRGVRREKPPTPDFCTPQ